MEKMEERQFADIGEKEGQEVGNFGPALCDPRTKSTS